MPNWIRNRIYMPGIAKLPLFTTYKGETEPSFDFNKLIKMPKSLVIQDGTMTDRAMAAALQKICKKQFDTPWGEPECTVLVKKDFFKEEEREKLEKEGYKYILNIIKYGHPTWYGWSYEHWGTKWNACETKIVSEDVIYFDTAWGNPEPVIKKIAERYPNATILHEWSDEDYANNCGERNYDGTIWHEHYIDNDSDEAKEMYNKLWNGNEIKEVQDEQ